MKDANQPSNPGGSTGEEIGAVQPDLLALMGSYRDLCYPEVCPVERSPRVRSTYCLHVLNHVLKANSQVLAHNAQLREHKSKKGAEVMDEPRDQGLTRPKVQHSLTAVWLDALKSDFCFFKLAFCSVYYLAS